MALLRVDDPATGELAARVELTPVEALDGLLTRAQAASRTLAAMSVAERVALCERFLTAFEAAGETIARDVSRMMGKPITEARSEVRTTGARARYMMSIAAEALAEIRVPANPGFEMSIERAPVGIVLDIVAWNYPLLIAVNVVVPAVLAGNAVILKHSSRTPLCAAHFADAFARAGAPAGAVTPLVADHATTADLAARHEIGYVAFTGSVEGGFEISRAASGRAVDVGLELGGKDPAYVRADADVTSVASALAEGAFYNAGQSCCAIERVYVHREVYEPFLGAAAAAAAAWRCGNPGDPATQLGPMAQPRGLQTVAAQVEDALAKGARLVAGGRSATVGGRGRYFEATVLADATHSMRVMSEETFGPVLPVAPVDSDEEAVRAMNDSRYGLTASIWTRDVERARLLGRQLEVGTVFLNRCDYLEPALPWSGWKDSGVGITLSRFGFDRLVRTRGFHLRLPG